jgi:hypothetical protein
MKFIFAKVAFQYYRLLTPMLPVNDAHVKPVLTVGFYMLPSVLLYGLLTFTCL